MGSRLNQESTIRHVPAALNRWLIIGLVIFVVLAIYPYSTGPASDIKILGYQIASFVALVLYMLSRRHAAPYSSSARMIVAVVSAFVLVNLVASVVSFNIGYSLGREMMRLLALFIIFLAAAESFRTPGQIWALFGAICMVTALTSLYGIVQYAGFDPFPWGESGGMLREAPATFGNPNFASHVLVIAVVLAFGLATQRRGRWVLLVIPLFAIHFSLTKTRGSMLGLGCAAVIVLAAIVVARWKLKPGWSIAWTCGSLILVGLIGAGAAVGKTIIERGEAVQFDRGDSITLRYHSFFGACEMIQDRPWLGYGPGMYQVFNPEYWTDFEQERTSRRNMMNFEVHNEPLQFAVEAGLLGGILYVALFVAGFTYGLCLWFANPSRDARVLGLTLAAFLVAFFVDSGFGFNVHVPASSTMLFILTGTLVGLLRDGAPGTVASATPFRPDRFWRVAIVVCAAAIPIFGVRDFLSKCATLRGMGAMEHKVISAAVESFEKACRWAPYDWVPRAFLGIAHMANGDMGKAVGQFERSVQLNPNNYNARSRLAEALFNVAAQSPNRPQDTLESAIANATYVAALSPYFEQPHDLLGRAAFLQAQWLEGGSNGGDPGLADRHSETAAAELLLAIEHGSGHTAKLYQIIALARLGREDFLGAQQAYLRAVLEQPSDLEIWQSFWQASERMNDYRSLITMLDRQIDHLSASRNPDAEMLLELPLLRARALVRIGDVSGAEQAFDRIVRDHPGRGDAWAAFHEFASANGRERAFTQSLLDISRKAEDGEIPLHVKAAAAATQHDEREIVQGLGGLVNALQGGSGSQVDSTQISWAVDMVAQGVRETTISTGTSGRIHLMLGLLYEGLGQLDTADDELKQAAASLGGDELVLALLTRGEVLTTTGNAHEAVDVLRRASNLAPQRFDARYAYANALAQDGQWAGAALEYQNVLASFQLDESTRSAIKEQAREAAARLRSSTEPPSSP